MNQAPQRIKDYLTDVSIDINERLGVFFVNVGIVAAFLGVLICLLAHEPVVGTIATALIAVGAPLIDGLTRHTGHADRYGSTVAVMIIIMIPIVWLTTGAWSGGTGFWFLYELFYITLFAKKKQLLPYITAAVLVQAAAITTETLHPEWFFHFTDHSQALVSIIGSGVVVTAEVLTTVFVQKTLYMHERQINTKSQDITRNFVTSIANTIDTKDPYTGGHSRRVAECASAIALRLGMSQAEADNMYFVALLHDIGKIGVPDSVLNKPGRLTDDEFVQIKKHPICGADILREVTTIPHVHDGVLYHHERYDGTGYPEGLKGEEIPFVARVISVADSYDAMSTTRIYRKYLNREEIINELIRCRGTQFDPHIVDVFVKMLMEGYDTASSPKEAADEFERALTETAGEMMRRIAGDNREDRQRCGVTNVDNNDFTNMYEYLHNLSRRYGEAMELISIALDTGRTAPDNDQLRDCMVDLNKAITQNTRSADICTRNSATSFLVLLLNVPSGGIENIIDRISTDFCHLQGNTGITLRCSIVDMDAQNFGKTNG